MNYRHLSANRVSLERTYSISFRALNRIETLVSNPNHLSVINAAHGAHGAANTSRTSFALFYGLTTLVYFCFG